MAVIGPCVCGRGHACLGRAAPVEIHAGRKNDPRDHAALPRLCCARIAAQSTGLPALTARGAPSLAGALHRNRRIAPERRLRAFPVTLPKHLNMA